MVVLCFGACGVLNERHNNSAYVSPIQFGLSEAKSDIERFYILEKSHRAALQQGLDVTYKGIDAINIEIPSDARSIPLGYNTDFHGVVINVRNNSKDFRLFSTVTPRKEITVPKWCIDSGDFRKMDCFLKGGYLLIIEDDNSWGDNRVGRDYAHIRKDLLLIKNGRSINKPVMPYNNGNSSPKCSFVALSGCPFVFKNLTVNRTDDCTYKTYVLYIDGYNDVQIENVTVNTPDNDFMGDHVLRIHNCSNVKIKHTKINGTYSTEEHSGYGVSMNNIWNFYACELYGRGRWGVFGTNNISEAVLEDCDINRFDIHCYGKNCTFKRVNFVNRDNQFSSVYGIIAFNDCTFTNFTPLVNRSSYNAYVGYELFFNNCVFNATPKKRYLLSLGLLDNTENSRPELKAKCWPNIHINNLTVNMIEGAKELVILANRVVGDQLPQIQYIKTIEIDGLFVYSDTDVPLKNIQLCPKEIKSENAIECKLNNVKIFKRYKDGVITKSSSHDVPLIINMHLKGGKAELLNVTGLRQVFN